VQKAMQIAQGLSNPQIDNVHLLKAIFEVDENVTPHLLKKAGVNVELLKQNIDQYINSLPKQQGGNLQLSRTASKTLTDALNLAEKMKDEYVSVEHLLLAIFDSNDDVSKMLKDMGVTKKGLEAAIQDGTTDVILEIPNQFERNLIKEKQASLSIQIDAINGAAAGVTNGYITQIVQGFNQKIRTKLMPFQPQKQRVKMLKATPSFWYNETLDYKTFMVPGIIVILVTMITFFLSGMNIVREKEIGTLEQMNVTPIKKYQFIIGKLLPFWLLGIFILFFGMNIGRFLFNVPLLGSPVWILLFASIYILVFLGMGFFISNVTLVLPVKDLM